jgi:hypothetical protein
LVHDAQRDDPGLAFALARLSHDDHSATPFGVFRDVQRGDYGQMVGRAGVAAPARRRVPGDLVRCCAATAPGWWAEPDGRALMSR